MTLNFLGLISDWNQLNLILFVNPIWRWKKEKKRRTIFSSIVRATHNWENDAAIAHGSSDEIEGIRAPETAWIQCRLSIRARGADRWVETTRGRFASVSEVIATFLWFLGWEFLIHRRCFLLLLDHSHVFFYALDSETRVNRILTQIPNCNTSAAVATAHNFCRYLDKSSTGQLIPWCKNRNLRSIFWSAFRILSFIHVYNCRFSNVLNHSTFFEISSVQKLSDRV